MGRRNKNYYKDLHQQLYDRFEAMAAYGESKRAAMHNGTAKKRSFHTAHTRHITVTPSILSTGSALRNRRSGHSKRLNVI